MDSKGLPSHAELKAALAAAVGSPPSGNGGFNLHMWATVVARDGGGGGQVLALRLQQIELYRPLLVYARGSDSR